MDKNITKNLNNKYSQKIAEEQQKKLVIYMQIKLLIELKVSKVSPQNNSEENIEHDTEIYRERYISPEQRQKIIDDLRLI